MSSQEFLYKAFWTIVKSQGRVHYLKLIDEFFKVTGYRISDFFEFEKKEMEQFLKMKKQMFSLDERGNVRALEYNQDEVFGISSSKKRQ